MEQTFKAKEPLSAVRVYVQMNRPSTDSTPIKLMTTFPRKGIFLLFNVDTIQISQFY